MEIKKKDKIGIRYGMLVALESFKNEANGRIWYKCRCDCGKIWRGCSSNLRTIGGAKSCGCNRYYGSRTKDWTSQRFERLIPIRPTEKRAGKSIIWLCRCDCGTEKEISAAEFVRGKTKSCGCLLREQKPKRYNPDRFSSLIEDAYMDNIVRRSKKKCFDEPNISLSDWRILCQRKCSYCGEPPSNKKKDQISGFVAMYNGLDRLNPMIGYSKDNISPCCRMCNRIKFTLSLEAFLSKIEVICSCEKSINRKFNPNDVENYMKRFGTCLKTLYRTKILKRSLEAGLSTDSILSLEEYSYLTSNNCFYCRAKPSQTRKFFGDILTFNGIDRLDSNLGYEYDNCVPCCVDCNNSKMDLSYDSFIEKIGKCFNYLGLESEDKESIIRRIKENAVITR